MHICVHLSKMCVYLYGNVGIYIQYICTHKYTHSIYIYIQILVHNHLPNILLCPLWNSLYITLSCKGWCYICWGLAEWRARCWSAGWQLVSSSLLFVSSNIVSFKFFSVSPFLMCQCCVCWEIEFSSQLKFLHFILTCTVNQQFNR